MARICREAGGRVTANVHLDLHLPNAADGRRLEVAVGGLPLFRGAQLAVDTTLVSAFHLRWHRQERCSPQRGSGYFHGRASEGMETSRTCWASCQISSGGSGLKSEAGGLLLRYNSAFYSTLARARAPCEGLLFRRRAEQAWRLHCWELLEGSRCHLVVRRWSDEAIDSFASAWSRAAIQGSAFWAWRRRWVRMLAISLRSGVCQFAYLVTG